MDPIFQIPEDGWYQIAALGEYKHKPTGLVQIIDAEACQAMAGDFAKRAAEPNFSGVLIDFDHFSLDPDKASEAAGWITAVEPRDTGLWAQIRWSDAGLAAVTGGRYRFVSPVWMKGDCEKCGEKQVRPMRLKNCALTNDPNIPGMVPLSNRAAPDALANARSKKTVDLAGLTIHIDRPAGFVQKGKDAQGEAWERTYKNDYGFLKKTNGGDDEELDVFVGPNPNAGKAYIVEQSKADGSFDELKLMLGFDNQDEACACYDAHIPAQYRQRVHECPVSLVHSLCNCDTDAIAGAVGAIANRKKCGTMKNSIANQCPKCSKPMRYDDGRDAYVCDACGAAGANAPAGIALSNRDAYHFARGVLNAERDIYLIPGTTIAFHNRKGCKPMKNAGPPGGMDDEQRRAMFARMHSGGGGGGGGGGVSGSRSRGARSTSTSTTSTSSSTSAPTTVEPPATLEGTTYDVGASNDTAAPPDAGGGSSGPTPITPNSPTRDSIARVSMYQEQIDALKAMKSQPPKTRDYSQIDVRQLEKDLYKQGGKGTNEIMKALADAKAENERRRDAVRDLKKRARNKYPNDRDKQKAELDKLLQKIVDEDAKAGTNWAKTEAALDKAIAKLEAAKDEETVRAQEELNKSAQRDMKAEAEAAEEQAKANQKAADKAAREQKAAQDAAMKAQIAKDKEEARLAAQKPKTPEQEFRSKQAKVRTYKDAIIMGDLDAAAKIFPDADVELDRKQYEDIALPSTSSAYDKKKSASAIADWKKELPPTKSRPVEEI